MTTIGNALVFIFGGGITAAIWLLLAALAYVSIIGIPFARSFIEFAKLSAFPFGKEIVRETEGTSVVKFGRTLFNILWFPFGALMWFLHLILGIVFALTIIGIPIAIIHARMGRFVLFPMGARVRPAGEVTSRRAKENVKGEYL